MIGGIYIIVNILNNHCYIGSSVNIQGRLNEHFRMLRSNHHYNTHIQHAYNKYGDEAFEVELLEECDTFELLEFEQYFMDIIKPEYNECPYAGGGSVPGRIASEETKEKIRQYRLGYSHTNETKIKCGRTFLGHHHTDEAKAKISRANVGHKHNVGRHHTDETKEKHRQSALLQHHPELRQ